MLINKLINKNRPRKFLRPPTNSHQIWQSTRIDADWSIRHQCWRSKSLSSLESVEISESYWGTRQQPAVWSLKSPVCSLQTTKMKTIKVNWNLDALPGGGKGIAVSSGQSELSGHPKAQTWIMKNLESSGIILRPTENKLEATPMIVYEPLGFFLVVFLHSSYSFSTNIAKP